ncbi:MAG: neutral/alkaline non-lysosomal ceramidase N-terminal domain-containing protein [Chitinophagales bacterium]|nr:neutral/alkaline non-lysosomal ceramidase N-terminal domain-containing protein [Chitinophagales bacterium]
MNKPYRVGVGKADITCLLYGKGMMGYGMHENVAYSIETPLYVRAFVIAQGTQKIVFVVAEICFYTIALKEAVVKTLQKQYPDDHYSDANVLLTAQHTHSGVGGYSHHILYNLCVPGFQQKNFDTIVKGTMEAIVMANNNMQTAELRFDKAAFSPNKKVAFNRSMPAYNNNPDVEKLPDDQAHLAVDRYMKLLRFDTHDGKAIGQINWFGVHTTSISNDNHRICSDNKGYAAAFFEQEMSENHPDFIAAFAQDVAGDVTPNYKWDKNKKWTRGKYKNDFKSAAHNGYLQCQHAKKLWATAKDMPAQQGEIDYALMFVDFSKVDIAPQFVGGKEGLHTVAAAQGTAFFRGTKEGPGMPSALGWVSNKVLAGIALYEKTWGSRRKTADEQMAVLRKHALHGNKTLFMESGIGRIWFAPYISKLVMPGFVDKNVAYFKRLAREGFTQRTPWIPQILPIQIILLGDMALLGIAAEITTVAGRRLQESVLEVLQQRGIRHVIINSYTNGYHGYITTPEEYDVQLYEGGHTVFGRYTLPAYQTKCVELAKTLLLPAHERPTDTTRPDLFSKEEIWYGWDK